MKKIVVAVAMFCVNLIANAGSVMWGSTTIYNASGAKVKNTATMYVYILTDADAYAALTDVWATYGNDVKAGGSSATSKATSNNLTSKATANAPNGTATANTTYYAAIIATYGTGDDMKYYVEKATATTGDDGNGTYQFGTGALDSAAAAAGAWKSAGGSSPVPEPTSGLLMLLGVAGLALKRKRA